METSYRHIQENFEDWVYFNNNTYFQLSPIESVFQVTY